MHRVRELGEPGIEADHRHRIDPGLTQQLAEFIAALDGRQIPAQALDIPIQNAGFEALALANGYDVPNTAARDSASWAAQAASNRGSKTANASSGM